MDQPGKVANPARHQLNRENEHSPCPRTCLRIWSRETGSAVPSRVSLLISILRLNLMNVLVYVFMVATSSCVAPAGTSRINGMITHTHTHRAGLRGYVQFNKYTHTHTQ